MCVCYTDLSVALIDGTCPLLVDFEHHFQVPVGDSMPDSWVSFKIRTFRNTKARSHPPSDDPSNRTDLNISEESEKETNLNINKHVPPVNTCKYP